MNGIMNIDINVFTYADYKYEERLCDCLVMRLYAVCIVKSGSAQCLSCNGVLSM